MQITNDWRMCDEIAIKCGKCEWRKNEKRTDESFQLVDSVDDAVN